MNKVKDISFPLDVGAYNCYGTIANANRFVTEKQLCDTSLWTMLIKQFTSDSDDVDNGWRGEFWGKLMRGACIVYRFTADKELYDVLVSAVKNLIKTRRQDGRICTYSKEKEFTFWDMWCRKYVMLGMEYFYDICNDDELKTQIIAALIPHADYILEHVGKGEGKIGIVQTSNEFGAMNSSSVLEPFVLLYNIIGEKKYIDFATYIVECGGSNKDNIFERAYKKDGFPYQYSATKAYEMMSCFEGLMEYYRATGIEKYKTAVLNFIDMISRTEITAIGSAGFTHELFDNSAKKQFCKSEDGIMQETCVTVTWMKLCYQALRLTGDTKYAGFIEHSAYNAMLGSLNTLGSNAAGGMIFDSYSPIYMQKRGTGMGGIRIIDLFNIFGCCVAIGAAGIGLSGIYAVMQRNDAIQINSFISGEYKACINGTDISVSVRTEYPKNGYAEIKMEEGEADVILRIPSFSEKTAVLHNGVSVPVKGDSVRIPMTGGERVCMFIDCGPRIVLPSTYGEDSAKVFAIFAGPLVLAQDSALGGDISVCHSIPEKFIPSFDKDLPEHQVAFTVTDKQGNYRVIDYASTGKAWSKDSLVTVWNNCI